MTLELIIIVTAFLAAFIHGVAGFGFALIAMPILAGFTSIYVAAPLVALATLTNNTLLCIYYRRSFDRTVVTQLLWGSVLGIPFGFLALQYIPTAWMLSTLGIVIFAYSLYALLSPEMPELKSQFWPYGAGFAAGILVGSYNLPGPPVVLYGNSQRWPQEKFKSNLTSFFWVNAILVVVGHGLQQRISPEIFHQFLITIPSLVIGLFLGVTLSKFFKPLIFTRIVLGVLMVIGIRLVILGVQS
ncbi:MAG: sulfite exporter TauE/SafE family protein [Leptolyngbya sp. SIO1D8]|nr:sulfite exporter TauE/SafE family protein [Leptolyngbya sp. SIO1D8]